MHLAAAPGASIAAALIGILSMTTGCRCEDEQPPVRARAHATALDSAPPPPPRPPPCRALRVKGTVIMRNSTPPQVSAALRDDAPLRDGAPITGGTWLELSADAEVVVKHTQSGREMTVRGPGRALTCRDAEEQVLLESGRFESTAGAGARPGAEVWIATPNGLVRYGDAELSVSADAQRANVEVTWGDAWVEATPGATLKGPEQLRGPKGKGSLVAGAATTPDALVEACRQTAFEAARTARNVLAVPDGGDAGTLGERAAAQLRARRRARALCASAAAALPRVEDPAQQALLWTRIERAERLGRAVPQAPK
jgi:hypothetical protein